MKQKYDVTIKMRNKKDACTIKYWLLRRYKIWFQPQGKKIMKTFSLAWLWYEWHEMLVIRNKIWV